MKEAHNCGRVGGLCILLVQLEGKSSLGRPKHRWKENIEIDFKEIGMEGVNFFRMAKVETSGWPLSLGYQPSGFIQ